LRARANRRRCISLAGLLALTLPGAAAPDFGAAAMLAAGIAGAYSLLGRRRSTSASPLSRRATSMRAVPFAMVLSALTLQQLHVTHLRVLFCDIAGTLTSGLGYAIWYRVLPSMQATCSHQLQRAHDCNARRCVAVGRARHLANGSVGSGHTGGIDLVLKGKQNAAVTVSNSSINSNLG
jgi:hypothetical protein